VASWSLPRSGKCLSESREVGIGEFRKLARHDLLARATAGIFASEESRPVARPEPVIFAYLWGAIVRLNKRQSNTTFFVLDPLKANDIATNRESIALRSWSPLVEGVDSSI